MRTLKDEQTLSYIYCSFSIVDNWLIKVYLNRYIVGRPNLLFIPIQLEHNFKNPYINRGSNILADIQGVWVYCYNQTYPGTFIIDPTNVAPNRAYKIGDLLNTFP